MNRRVSLVVFLSFALVALAGATSAPAGRGPNFMFATGEEVTFNVVDPGTVTCIGGEATGDPYDPCHESQRVMLKHQVVQTMLLPGASGDAAPLLDGTATVTIDCNLDGDLRGHCWGVFEWQVDAESRWAGVVSGTFDFRTFSFVYRLVGRGFGGTVDGMQLQYDVSYDGGYDFIGDFVARVHSPRAEAGGSWSGRR
jgi:hypothetical protein